MKKTKNDIQKDYFSKFSRPTITIPKEKNDIYKQFVTNKGYKSLNDYINIVLAYDVSENIIPCKSDIPECYKPQNNKSEL